MAQDPNMTLDPNMAPQMPGDTSSVIAPDGTDVGTGDIDKALGEFKGRASIAQNRLDQFRQVIIQAMFKLMKDAGVDVNDLDSIRGFLASLEEQDPDLAELFDVAFNDMTGEDSGEGEEGLAPEGALPEGGGLMDKYSNLAGSVMGPEGTPPPAMGGMQQPPASPMMPPEEPMM